MNKWRITFLTFLSAFLLLYLAISPVSLAREKSDDAAAKNASNTQLLKIAGEPLYQILNINNLVTWMAANGISNHTPKGDNGVFFPRGTTYTVYQDGIMWGGKCYTDQDMTKSAPFGQLIRVGGANYITGCQAGWIEGFGASARAVDPGDPRARIYRIRRDYTTMSEEELKRDAAESNEININNVTSAMIEKIKQQYETDWKEWPVDLGAPFIDRNGNGVYDPPPPFSDTFGPDDLIEGGYDEPGIAGSDPNSPADMVLWTVYNDLDRNQTVRLQGSEPIGLEVQVTIWGYKRTDPLGNIYFKRVRIINKGGVDTDGSGTIGAFWVDSMYVAQWSDPDLGSFADDLVGCDTTLSMGFVYNGHGVDTEFRKFNLPPAAGGYDFLQGPIIYSPGDSAVFDLKRIYDYKNLGMTSFSYFSAGSAISDPPRDYTRGTLRWYKMLRGYAPVDGPLTYYPFPPGMTPNKFPLSGDPVTQTGFIDGQGKPWSFAPGDRRLNVSTGPFNLAPGDTQEVVVAYVAGLGADRLSSVAVMKFNDRFAQNTYDALFQVPKPPVAPNVKVSELDGEVILEWGSDIETVRKTETRINQPGGYKFEGYNVYQFPSRNASKSEAKRIVTYDLITDPTVVLDEQFDPSSGQILQQPVQFGSNSGIKRFFKFDRDYIKDVDKIYNGQEYYLAVTAYSVATVPGFLPKSLESKPNILTVKPKVPFGVRYKTAYGDTLPVEHVSGRSDGIVRPIVVDPTASTGHTYEVVFDTVGGQTVWGLRDVDLGQMVLTGQTNQTGDDNYAIVDGIFLKVQGPPPGIKAIVEVANGNGPLPEDQWDNAGKPYHGNNVWHSLSASSDPNRWYISAGGGAGNIERMARNIQNAKGHDFEMRFTDAGGYYLWWYDADTVAVVPFEAWDVGIGTFDDNSDDIRLLTGGYSGGATVGSFDFAYTDPAFGYPATDWIYMRRPLDDQGTWDVFVQDITSKTFSYSWWPHTEEVLARIIICDFGGGGTLPEKGTVIRWITNKPNDLNDVFRFTAPAPLTGPAEEEFSAKNVGVFPNPYYAFNPAETSRLSRFVTFNNLPPKVTIRIFNLGGQFVRKLEKNDASQFLRWDLLNHTGTPVASGVYIAYVEMKLPSNGKTVTKILKLAIIQEQEVLDVY